MRLSEATLGRLSASVERFHYDRRRQDIGIVHLGVGAFHRAHQAWYTDLALDAGDGGWSIVGVSLRSEAVAAQLNPQDGLYSVTVHDGARHSTRVLGCLRHVVAATSRPAMAEAVSAIASPATQIVTLTVTEKGYTLCGGGEDADKPSPIFPLLAAGLRERRLDGASGLTLLSCDNVPRNGARLASVLAAYLSETDRETASWFRSQCSCPSSMVDRIVPATTEADRQAAASALGLEDEAAIVTEAFSDWIIEDCFAGARPNWDRVGVRFTRDIQPFETAKLRMLNGAHSALAYLGLERGHRHVHEAISDPAIRGLVQQLIEREAAESFVPAQDQDLRAYTALLLHRFANPALPHRLDQIATDGSHKIPQRWLATLADRRANGWESPSIMAALAAWVRFVRGDHARVSDPLAGELRALWLREGEGGIAAALFSDRGMFANALTPDEQRQLTLSLGP